jgi:rare lipoprotein A (peptidoglycan hydrolase)
MADGTKMKPQGNNAASKTLPLGTTATVTNIETGQCAVVTIQDRGPYVKGRIVDLSPHTAQKIGITRDKGLAKVQVAPIAVPLPDGSTKPGVAAHDEIPDKRICADRANDDAGSLREHSALRPDDPAPTSYTALAQALQQVQTDLAPFPAIRTIHPCANPEWSILGHGL